MEHNPTTLSELEKYAGGAVVQLPDFADGMPLYVRMRRPSMLDMIAAGKIPNPLVDVAMKLFVRGGKGVPTDDAGQIKNLIELFHLFCEVCFVEPTYQQIKEAGLELNDEQLVSVSNFVQGGTKALERFRRQSESNKRHLNVPEVRQNAVRTAGNK